MPRIGTRRGAMDMADVIRPRAVELERRNNAYHLRENAVKSEQREKIKDFILDVHTKNDAMRFLGLPGQHWAFETLLANTHTAETVCIGAEWSLAIMETSLPYMPGRYKPIVIDREFKPLIKVSGWKRGYNRVLHANVLDLLGVNAMGLARRQDRQRWRNRYVGNFTAVWLDFMGPVTQSMLDGMKNLEHTLNRGTHRVPVAISFMIGRELPTITTLLNIVAPESLGHSPVERRAQLLAAMMLKGSLRVFDPIHAWTYEGEGGVTMGTVMGISTRKQSNR